VKCEKPQNSSQNSDKSSKCEHGTKSALRENEPGNSNIEPMAEPDTPPPGLAPVSIHFLNIFVLIKISIFDSKSPFFENLFF